MNKPTKLYTILSKIPNLNKQKILSLANKTCEHGHSLLEHINCASKILNLPKEKIGFLDIESSNLKANWGVCLTYCIKEAEGEILFKTITKEDIESKQWDYYVIKQLCIDLKKFDRVIGYYSTKFDIPFLRTRAMKYNLDFPVFKEVLHTDLYRMVKDKLCLHSRRLAVPCEFFGISAKDHPIKPEIFMGALSGDKECIDYVLTHNKEDVISTELLYNKIVHYSGKANTSI